MLIFMPCFPVVYIICTTRVKDQTWQFHNAIWELKSPKAIVSLKKHEQTGTYCVQLFNIANLLFGCEFPDEQIKKG